jgi:lipoprotein-releasing system permease protein
MRDSPADCRGVSNAPARRFASLGLLFFFAARSLWQSPLNLGLLLAAVTFGTGLQIPNSANLAGYTQELLEQGVSRGSGEVVVRPKQGRLIEHWGRLREELHAIPWVRYAIPRVLLPGTVGVRGRFEGAPVVGLSPDRGDHRLTTSAGSMLREGDREGILLGASLADRLGVSVGDKVRVRVLLDVPQKKGSALAIDDDPVGRFDLVVRGVVLSSFGGSTMAFVDRDLLVQKMGEGDVAHWVAVYSLAPHEAEAQARFLESAIPGISARPWNLESTFVPNAIDGNRTIEVISGIMVLIAVTIPVWALLYISVQHRRTEIGILSAMGFSRGDIFVTFLLQGVLVGLAGVFLGTGLGAALTVYFREFPVFEMRGFVIRPLLTAGTLLWPGVVVFGATVVASIYPALAAARVYPAVTLRGAE